MSLSDAFLGHHIDVQLLVFAQKHHLDRILLFTLGVCVLDGYYRIVWVDRHDVFRSDLKLVAVLADAIELEVDRAFAAHLLASALFAANVGVDLVTYERDQSEPMGNELIVKCRCVFANFHDVDGKRWHF